MSDHRDSDLPTKSDLPFGEDGPLDDLYAEQNHDIAPTDLSNTAAPYARPRSSRWGRIALIAAAVILGLALLSAMLAPDIANDRSFATVEDSDVLVTGSVPSDSPEIVPAN